ncbi:MAG: aspartate carbamoyltransferase catalytic subunit [Desulfarculaceae bacterium]|nr:aspartate carbamoyltransferase catalytic subunit [Desulfarculaceae bacterium]
MSLSRRNLLGLEGVSAEEITTILDTAESLKEISYRPIRKVPTLRGKTIVHFFYEASTRTRTSFELAAKRLSGDTVSLSASTSSLTKGETLIDTAKNLLAMSPDCIVMRHSQSGAPHLLAKHIPISIINAGDGAHEHPSQGLLDMLTIRQAKGHLDGLKVSIIGDITHSRVARSDLIGLTTMGSEVTFYGPRTLIPPAADTLGAKVATCMEEAVEDADVIIMLRVQQERLTDVLFPTLREYAQRFGLGMKQMRAAKKDVVVMHPGPINRGVEMSPEVADGPWSLILDQVANGVAVRMALLYLLIGPEAA